MIKFNIPEFKNVGSAIVDLTEGSEHFFSINRMAMELGETPETKKFIEQLKNNPIKNGNLLQIDIFECKNTALNTRSNYLPLLNSEYLSFDIKNLPIFKSLEELTAAIKNSKNLKATDEYMNSAKCKRCFTDFDDNAFCGITLNEQTPIKECHDPDSVTTHAEMLERMFHNMIKKLVETSN